MAGKGCCRLLRERKEGIVRILGRGVSGLIEGGLRGIAASEDVANGRLTRCC